MSEGQIKLLLIFIEVKNMKDTCICCVIMNANLKIIRSCKFIIYIYIPDMVYILKLYSYIHLSIQLLIVILLVDLTEC